MKKILVWCLILAGSLALILRFSNSFAEIFLGVKQVAGISILSTPQEKAVYLDGKEAGKTPYEDKNLEVKTYTVKIGTDKSAWEGKVKLGAGTITAINRDLGPDGASSAGEMLTLEKGKGLTIVSNPQGADVEVDGKSAGKAPVKIEAGLGEHTILISHPNYLKRSIRANLPEGYNLIVAADLALSEADLTAVQTPAIKETLKVKVKDTPTGFLRVRDKPNLNGKEIARMKPGDELILLEELSGWDRIRLADNTEGYVSSAYVEKMNNF